MPTGYGQPMAYERALPRREASLLSARACGATCQLRPPTPSQRRDSRAAQARRRSLSLGRRRSTQACCVRAPCRAACGWPRPYERALHWQDASLLRRAPVVRRASCALQRQPMPRVLRVGGAPALAVSGGGGAAPKLAASARHAAQFMVSPWRIKGHCLGKRPFPFDARPRCDVPAAASSANQYRVSCAAQARRRSLSLAGEAQH